MRPLKNPGHPAAQSQKHGRDARVTGYFKSLKSE
jgi:hypothetical protein